ncbi:MAG: hypothetical protein ACRD3I_05570 [Terriglobales bacterium]
MSFAHRRQVGRIRRCSLTHHRLISDVVERQASVAAARVGIEPRGDTTAIPPQHVLAQLGRDRIPHAATWESAHAFTGLRLQKEPSGSLPSQVQKALYGLPAFDTPAGLALQGAS